MSGTDLNLVPLRLDDLIVDNNPAKVNTRNGRLILRHFLNIDFDINNIDISHFHQLFYEGDVFLFFSLIGFQSQSFLIDHAGLRINLRCKPLKGDGRALRIPGGGGSKEKLV